MVPMCRVIHPVVHAHDHPIPRRGSRLLRRGRHSEAGRIYLITFATANRAPLLADWNGALAVSRVLYMPAIWSESRLLCWVLMPDHWHGLVELGPQEDLSRLVRRLKGITSRKANQARERSGALWAEGFHDHALRAEEHVLDVARYIVLNPVRAGLVKRVGDYPFWDAVWIDQVHRG
ncbi:REP-associated tyrosine transposase [Dokdonella sp.]|uniref:REP-associated tyrosine transposase n=1 Tax=Dokdonella sp. TaxID=2291710 RepID=UPI003AF4A032